MKGLAYLRIVGLATFFLAAANPFAHAAVMLDLVFETENPAGGQPIKTMETPVQLPVGAGAFTSTQMSLFENPFGDYLVAADLIYSHDVQGVKMTLTNVEIECLQPLPDVCGFMKLEPKISYLFDTGFFPTSGKAEAILKGDGEGSGLNFTVRSFVTVDGTNVPTDTFGFLLPQGQDMGSFNETLFSTSHSIGNRLEGDLRFVIEATEGMPGESKIELPNSLVFTLAPTTPPTTAAVPEPASAILFAIALCGLLTNTRATRWRRNR